MRPATYYRQLGAPPALAKELARMEERIAQLEELMGEQAKTNALLAAAVAELTDLVLNPAKSADV